VRRVLFEGVSKKRATREGNIPRGTLQRHVKKAESGMGIIKKLGRSCVLTAEQEDDLVERILDNGGTSVWVNNSRYQYSCLPFL